MFQILNFFLNFVLGGLAEFPKIEKKCVETFEIVVDVVPRDNLKCDQVSRDFARSKVGEIGYRAFVLLRR